MTMRYYIYSNKLDYFRAMCADIIDDEKVTYISDPFKHFNKNKFIRALYWLHSYWLFNILFKLPFQGCWSRYMFKGELSEPTCFVFFMDYVSTSNDYEKLFSKLKSNPNVKLVAYFEDLVSSRKGIRFDLLNKYFNLVLTYDQGDAEKYGFTYYPSFLSKIPQNSNVEIARSQACFYGAAKKRYNLILDVYRKLKSLGISCDFGVSRMGKSELKLDGITYIDYIIPYSEYVQHLYNTDCIVEIVQDNSVGFTLRTWEALIYGKKLLTNNKSILKAQFYNDNQFCYFDNYNEIDTSFFSREYNPHVDYNEQLSPRALLTFLEKNI